MDAILSYILPYLPNVLLGADTIALVIVGLILRSFAPQYASEKAKNLATKQDIGEITERIERVRNQYASELETLRSELARQSHTYNLRFEKELDIFRELWAALVDLRGSVLAFRTAFRPLAEKLSEDEVKAMILESYSRCFRAFRDVYEKNRPFYPQNIYQTCDDILKIGIQEATQFQHGNKDSSSYWEDARGDEKKLVEKIDVVCELIQREIFFS